MHPTASGSGLVFLDFQLLNELGPLLRRVLLSSRLARTRRLPGTGVSIGCAPKHNMLNITHPMPEKGSWFHDRPYLVIQAEEFAHAIQNSIQDEQVRTLPPFAVLLTNLLN
jgi:hypothetical protein